MQLNEGHACILRWPLASGPDPGRQVFCLPVLLRNGGCLAAVPAALLSSAQEAAGFQSPPSVLGPFTVISVPGIEEEEEEEEEEQGDVLVRMDLDVLLVDLDESALGSMRRYDPVTDLVFEAYVPEAAHIMPQPETLVASARAWVEEEAGDRLAFYSAREEEAQAPPAISPKRPAPRRESLWDSCPIRWLRSQRSFLAWPIKSVSWQSSRPQQRPGLPHHPHLSRPSYGSPTGVPRDWPLPCKKVQAKAQAPVIAAPPAGSTSEGPIPRQSRHATRGGVEHAWVASYFPERDLGLDGKLAAGNLNFFLQVTQAAHRRLHPALPVPSTLEEAQAGGRVGGGGYDHADACKRWRRLFQGRRRLRERASSPRFGSYRTGRQRRRSLGPGVLADSRKEAPPTARPAGAANRMRAFSPLVPAGLGAVTQAYVREVDLLAQRRRDAVNPLRPQPKQGRAGEPASSEAQASLPSQGKGSRLDLGRHSSCFSSFPGRSVQHVCINRGGLGVGRAADRDTWRACGGPAGRIEVPPKANSASPSCGPGAVCHRQPALDDPSSHGKCRRNGANSCKSVGSSAPQGHPTNPRYFVPPEHLSFRAWSVSAHLKLEAYLFWDFFLGLGARAGLWAFGSLRLLGFLGFLVSRFSGLLGPSTSM